MLVALLLLLAAAGLAFVGAPFWAWTIAAAATLATGTSIPVWIVFAAIAIVGNLPPLRARLLSAPVMRLLAKLEMLPQISAIELSRSKRARCGSTANPLRRRRGLLPSRCRARARSRDGTSRETLPLMRRSS